MSCSPRMGKDGAPASADRDAGPRYSPGWFMTTERAAEIDAFLNDAGWAAARRTPMPGDASTRRYIRLDHAGRRAMLMDQPQGAEAPVASATSTPDERRALGYNAVARLAGADVGRFV